jgi:hypothetical protein
MRHRVGSTAAGDDHLRSPGTGRGVCDTGADLYGAIQHHDSDTLAIADLLSR